MAPVKGGRLAADLRSKIREGRLKAGEESSVAQVLRTGSLSCRASKREDACRLTSRREAARGARHRRPSIDRRPSLPSAGPVARELRSRARLSTGFTVVHSNSQKEKRSKKERLRPTTDFFGHLTTGHFYLGENRTFLFGVDTPESHLDDSPDRGYTFAGNDETRPFGDSLRLVPNSGVRL